MKKNIYLIGFMGAGKTILGEKIALKLNLPFYDLDYEIEKYTKTTIPNIFKQYGERYFRKVESEILLSNNFDGIISCGGGIVENIENRDFLKNQITVWIKVPWEIIWKRIKESDRPLVKRYDYTALKKLFYKREKFYKEIATHIIEKDFLNNLEKIIKKSYQTIQRNGN